MSSELNDYDHQTSKAAQVGAYIAGPINGATNLNMFGAFAAGLPVIGQTVSEGLDEINQQKDSLISSGLTHGIEMVGSDKLSTIESFLKQAESFILKAIMQVTGWNPERNEIGATMVAAHAAADAATLQAGIARQLDQALSTPEGRDLPPASVVAKAVAEGIAGATQSAGAMKADAVTAVKQAVERITGKEPSSTDSRALAFEISSSIHASVFQASKEHFAASYGGVEKLTPEQLTAAQEYAAKAAQTVSGLSVADLSKGPEILAEKKGMAGYLDKQLAAAKEGRSLDSSEIVLAPQGGEIRATPTPAAAPESQAAAPSV